MATAETSRENSSFLPVLCPSFHLTQPILHLYIYTHIHKYIYTAPQINIISLPVTMNRQIKKTPVKLNFRCSQ